MGPRGRTVRDDRRAFNVTAAERERYIEAARSSEARVSRLADSMGRWFDELARPVLAEAAHVTFTHRDFPDAVAQANLDGQGCAHPRLSTVRQGLEATMPLDASGFVCGELGKSGERGRCDMCGGNAHAHGMLWLVRDGSAVELVSGWRERCGFVKVQWGTVRDVAMAYATKYAVKDSTTGASFIATAVFGEGVRLG